MHLWKISSQGEVKLLLSVETLGKKFIPEVNLGINFVKTLSKDTKNCIKNKEINVLNLGGKCTKECFHKVTDNDIATNKKFWNLIRPFPVNKGS